MQVVGFIEDPGAFLLWVGPLCPAKAGVGHFVSRGINTEMTLVGGICYERAVNTGRELRSPLDCCGFACRISLRHFRHGCHQSLRVFVAGTSQDFLSASSFNDLSFMQNGDPVANSGDRTEVMRDVENCHS